MNRNILKKCAQILELFLSNLSFSVKYLQMKYTYLQTLLGQNNCLFERAIKLIVVRFQQNMKKVILFVQVLLNNFKCPLV